MKVFISGPMSGKPNGNKEAFFKAEYKLKRLGYSVFNPAWCKYGYNTEFTEDDMHMIDFSALSRCDAIYMLKGWQYSKGAKAEYDHAKILCKAILREGDPITDPLICDKYDWESFKNKLPDRLDITSKHPRVMKPIDDCFSIYDYIGPNTPEFDKEFAYDEAIKNRTNYQLEAIKENIKESRNETRYKCNGLNRAINNVEADLDNFKDETDGKINDIYDTLHRHGENIDSCQYDIRSIGRRLNNNYADSANKIYSLKKEVEAIKEFIGTDNLQEQLEKDFADVYEEFQNTKDQVNDINMGYIKWSSEVSQFDERIEKLEENMKEIAANGGLGLSFNLMNERVSSNKRDISSLRNDIDIMHSWINIHDRTHREESKQMSDLGSELDEYIDDYKEAYKHLDNADEALERRIKDLEKKSDDCTKRMNLFSRELETYEEAYKQLRTSLDNNDNALERRIKAIEKRLNIKPFYAPTEDEKDD